MEPSLADFAVDFSHIRMPRYPSGYVDFRCVASRSALHFCRAVQCAAHDRLWGKEAYDVTKEGESVHLTPTEFRLLAALVRGHGKVLTHRQLLLDVWGPGYINRPHYIRLYMANLRQKLEREPTRPEHLITELQVGYRLAGIDDRL
jgi:hypothetical protein